MKPTSGTASRHSLRGEKRCPDTQLRRGPLRVTGEGTMVRDKPLDALAINAVFEIGYPDFSDRIM